MVWFDYSAGRPPGAAIRAAGGEGVIRYIGLGSESKQITGPEYQDLIANGVKVLLVVELDVNDAWGGPYDDDRARGRANATLGLNAARARGIPDSVGMAAAADAHAANAQQISDAVEYARGFEDVLGKARTGFYGFFETLNAVHAAGVGSWYWRCGAEPQGADRTWVNFWQRNAGQTTTFIQGVQCDINDMLHPPSSAGVPDVTPEEHNMLVQVHNQLVGPWPSYVDPNVKLSLVDFARAIDQHTFAPEPAATVALHPADVDTIATAVLAKLGPALADQVADKLAARLVS